MRILAVDDDPIVLDLLRDALTGDDMQCDLVCCETAEDAMEVMDTDPTQFDCFLLDIMLPGIDGIELCDMVRQKAAYRATPIIMITASRDPSLMGRAFGAGATDFVTKPLNGLDLGARINTAAMLNDSLLRERQAQHSLAEMTAKMRIRFDEVLALETKGVTDFRTLENELLRLPEGCYQMQLFSLDVVGLRDVHENVSAPAFRQHLEAVATAATGALDGLTFKLAYAGQGRFAGYITGRGRLKTDDVVSKATAALQAAWDTERCEADTPPMLRVETLSDRRLWSGRSAGDRLHEAMEALAVQEAAEMEAFEPVFAMAAE
ncbi:PleD family two-component system response regulator [Marimonas sp. MJW-29]|uniref:PleD family two-component system response regulator n=1 Tax=Sulfitobacter sediminis TaxID=3234186 RepID=A0ABV3RQA0_9RHOB